MARPRLVGELDTPITAMLRALKKPSMGLHLCFVEAGCGSQTVDHRHSGVERKGIMNQLVHGRENLSITESYAVAHDVK
jgi:hypothetical protein